MNMGTLQSNALIKAGLIIGVSLVLGLLFDYFFYAKILGVAFPLYVVLVASGLFAVAGFLNKQISKEALLLLAPLIFFSVMVFVRSSALLTLLNIAASLLLLLVIAEVSFDGKLKNFFIADYIKIFLLPFKFILPLFQTLSDLFATLVYIGAYSYIFREAKNQNESPQNNKTSSFSHIESSILLGSVNVLFFVFILVQFAYLFGGEGNISAQGFTYAEYARRGFFELIAVSIISLLLLLAIEKYIIKENENHARGFKILSTALVIQVILIMVSAFTRLTLYEEAYGFTILRFYSHAFIILLAAV